MLSFLIDVFQDHPCQFLTFGVDITPDFVDALKIPHLAGGESSRVESTPNITLVPGDVGQSALSVKLTITWPRNHHGVMIHEDDLNLPLTFVPKTLQPHISPDERLTPGKTSNGQEGPPELRDLFDQR